jgi:hypothetical protein
MKGKTQAKNLDIVIVEEFGKIFGVWSDTFDIKSIALFQDFAQCEHLTL